MSEAKLERLCRTISRPALSQARLSLTPGGLVRYQLKTPYSEGTTHVLFEPLDFIARLAALVPKPRVNLTHFHGVFAPNSAHRARVTKVGRGKGATGQAAAQTDDTTPAERRASMTWAQRLKRVFGIDIVTCAVCGGAMRILACIEDPVVIEKILAHLHEAPVRDAKAAAVEAARDTRQAIGFPICSYPRVARRQLILRSTEREADERPRSAAGRGPGHSGFLRNRSPAGFLRNRSPAGNAIERPLLFPCGARS
jgi:hypothetical protein